MPFQNIKIAIVCNPKAGNGKSLQLAYKIAVELNAIEVTYNLFTATWPVTFNDVSQIWIIGGDGTLNYFINQYPELEIPLSIFPGGTGNDFQRLLYGDTTVTEQIKRVLNNQIALIDAGLCNDKLFINGVGIGFDGAIVKDLLHKKKSGGKISYMMSVLKKIITYEGREHVVTSDTKQLSEKLLMVNVSNGKTEGGGFRVAPEADLFDGKLDINIVKELTTLQRLSYLPHIEKGKHLNLPLIDYYQDDKIQISTSAPITAHRDGEYFEANNFVIKCLPKRFAFLR